MAEPLEFPVEGFVWREVEPFRGERRFTAVWPDGAERGAWWSESDLRKRGVTVPPPLPVKHKLIVEYDDMTDALLARWARFGAGPVRDAARAKCDELGIDWRDAT